MALANFGWEKLCKVKKAYFMIKEINLIREKQPFLTYTPFLNEGKVKFLQIKHDTIRQKNEKSVRIHEA